MCGILVALRHTPADAESTEGRFEAICEKLTEAVSARGPDARGSCRMRGPTFDEVSMMDTAESHPTQARKVHGLEVSFFAAELRLRGDFPVVQPHNGDGRTLCWNGEIFEGLDIAPHENDGVKLFEAFRTLTTPEEVRDLLGSIEGPYALVYFDRATRQLYVARDPLGRRSLLIHRPTVDHPYLLLTSVSSDIPSDVILEELSTDFIYHLDLGVLNDSNDFVSAFAGSFVGMPRVAPGIIPPTYAIPARVCTTLLDQDRPVVKNLENIPEVLIGPVDELIRQLDYSVRLRVETIPKQLPGRARLAVLFSGGIDSAVVAFLAHRHIPIDEPIDLLNVAFENPRKIRLQQEENLAALPKAQKKKKPVEQAVRISAEPPYMVPDRVIGLEEVEELRRLCPGRVWNFVEVNVPYEESQASRQTIEALIIPGRTVMDLSLALALYFAARGVGQVWGPSGPKPYTSTARVLLNGLGSDELLGGYGRHRTVYASGGWPAVIEELQLEIDRIPTRNLGRDDRVVSSHGKEARHPFLSLNVVRFLAELPVQFKLDPELALGLGDKMLLRLAVAKLGLTEASKRKKRAMQFGSRSARMEGERRGDMILETSNVLEM